MQCYVQTYLCTVSNKGEFWAMCFVCAVQFVRLAQDMLHDVLRASLVLS